MSTLSTVLSTITNFFASISVLPDYIEVLESTDRTYNGRVHAYCATLSKEGQLAFKTLAGIVNDFNEDALDTISRSTEAHPHIAQLVGCIQKDGALTDDQLEEAKTWVIRMAAQRMTDKGYVPTDTDTLPPDFEVNFVEDHE